MRASFSQQGVYRPTSRQPVTRALFSPLGAIGHGALAGHEHAIHLTGHQSFERVPIGHEDADRS